MKRIRVAVFFLAATAMCFSTTSLLAQPGRMMRMMGGGSMELDSTLLAMEEVQTELAFTDEQKESIGEKASELNSTLRSEMRAIFGGGGGDQSEMAELMDELREEEKDFVKLLSEDQSARFQQLKYQRMGNTIYRKEEVQKEIGMTDECIEAIEDAFTSGEEEMRAAIAEARESGDFATIRETMDSLQKKLLDTIDENLTDEQKTKVDEMKGEPFEFPRRQRRQRNRSDF